MTRQTAIQNATPNAIQLNGQSEQPQQGSWSYMPALDAIELPGEYVIVCEAPGLNIAAISLTYENGWLHLHAPVAQRAPQDANFLRQEYGVGDFDRRIPLGEIAEFIDGERISAEYATGLLKIHLPKLQSAQARQIPVKGA